MMTKILNEVCNCLCDLKSDEEWDVLERDYAPVFNARGKAPQMTPAEAMARVVKEAQDNYMKADVYTWLSEYILAVVKAANALLDTYNAQLQDDVSELYEAGLMLAEMLSLDEWYKEKVDCIFVKGEF